MLLLNEGIWVREIVSHKLRHLHLNYDRFVQSKYYCCIIADANLIFNEFICSCFEFGLL